MVLLFRRRLLLLRPRLLDVLGAHGVQMQGQVREAELTGEKGDSLVWSVVVVVVVVGEDEAMRQRRVKSRVVEGGEQV